VRGHAAWALGRIGTEAARQALRGREEVEEDAWVREEVESALDDPSLSGSVQDHGPR
jgi:epoxyqueuosine reductase